MRLASELGLDTMSIELWGYYNIVELRVLGIPQSNVPEPLGQLGFVDSATGQLIDKDLL